MNQSEAITEGLKKILSSKKMNYTQLAKKLKISTASVKRIFSERTFTLQRLEEICDILDITMLDLVKVAEIKSHVLMYYTYEQEEYIASDAKAYAVWMGLLNDRKVKDFKKRARITEKELASILRKLDLLKLIEWLPQDKIKILVDRETKWTPGGPLVKKYADSIKKEFLDSDFQSQNELFRMLILALTPAQMHKAMAQLNEFAEEWGRTSNIERQVTGRPDDVGFVFAVRPFEFSISKNFWK